MDKQINEIRILTSYINQINLGIMNQIYRPIN